MYNYLKGTIAEKIESQVIIDVNGVGYELTIPLSTYNDLLDIDNEVKIYTYLHVREDILKLYGFSTKEAKDFFTVLISISGLGPKVALSILSSVKINEFRQAVLEEDVLFITKIPGIGKKSAERIILEVKSKIEKLYPLNNEIFIKTENRPDNTIANDVVLALMALGYKEVQARDSIKRVADSQDISKMDLQEIIARCLK